MPAQKSIHLALSAAVLLPSPTPYPLSHSPLFRFSSLISSWNIFCAYFGSYAIYLASQCIFKKKNVLPVYKIFTLCSINVSQQLCFRFLSFPIGFSSIFHILSSCDRESLRNASIWFLFPVLLSGMFPLISSKEHLLMLTRFKETVEVVERVLNSKTAVRL